VVSVDSDKCIGCGVCESLCPAGVFWVTGGKASVARGDECILCGNCESSCPVGCITAGRAAEATV